MGDSDDEYDRRRRDKFRRERSDYDRSREREDRRRDDWNDRWENKWKPRLPGTLTTPRICMLRCSCACMPDLCCRRCHDQRVGQRPGTSQPWGVPGLWQRPKGEVHPAATRHEPPAETHEKRLVRWAAVARLRLPSSCALSLTVFGVSLPGRDDHGGDPYRGGYDLGYSGGGGPSYGPPQHWGHPDLHLMQPHHGIPIQARWEAVWLVRHHQHLSALLLRSDILKISFPAGLATSMTWI